MQNNWDLRLSQGIHDLLQHNHAYLPTFAKHLLPMCLEMILSPTLDMQISSSHALAGFALAIVSYRGPRLPSIRAHVWDYLARQFSRTAAKDASPRLEQVIEVARGLNPTNHSTGKTWAASLLGSFAILLGPKFFVHRRLRRLCDRSLGAIGTGASGASVELGLTSAVLRCGIWLYADVLQRPVKPGEIDMRHKAFEALNTDLRGGAGTCLVGVLLAADPAYYPASVSNAVQVTHRMLSFPDNPTQAAGMRLFIQMIRKAPIGSGAESSWNKETVIIRTLFTKCALATERTDDIAVALAEEGASSRSVRSLGDSEIVAEWEMLVLIWSHAAHELVKIRTRNHTRETPLALPMNQSAAYSCENSTLAGAG
jgi:hypothetical protein